MPHVKVSKLEVHAHNSHVRNRKSVAAIDGNGLYGRVLDVQVGNGRVRQVVGVEELGLGLAAVGALSVPPSGTVGVEVGAGRAFNGDLVALDLQKRAIPLLVAPSGLALEDDLCSVLATFHRATGLPLIAAHVRDLQ